MMLKTPRGYHFDQLRDSTTAVNYKISPNDFITMRLFSNDGFHLIDLTSQTGAGSTGGASLSTSGSGGIEYLVENDGSVNLPEIRRTLIAGLTIREATEMLEKAYS